MVPQQTTQNKSAERFFFDEFAAQEKWDAFTNQGTYRLFSEFLQLVRPKKTERLLELGCGTGSFSRQALASVQALIGLDISFVSLVVAREDVPESLCVMGDIEHIPFPDDSFDIVVYSGVLHHFPSLQRAVREGLRVLRPGGRCFGYDPNLYNPAMWLYRRLPLPLDKRHTVNERLLAAREVEVELTHAGFSTVVVQAIAGVTYEPAWVKGYLSKGALSLYNMIEELLNRTPLARKFGSFLISFAVK